MSYILDALVKADRERQRREVPGLATVQTLTVLEAREGLPWTVVLPGLVLAAGLAALFWARPWHKPPSLAEPVAAAPAVRTRPAAVPEEAAIVIQVAPALPPAPPQPAAKIQPAARVAVAPVAADGEPRPENRLYSLSELPAALRREADKLSVAGFARSPDASGPLAIINDRALREGDEVAAGLRVERISSDGVVFNLKGYRFRKGAS